MRWIICVILFATSACAAVPQTVRIYCPDSQLNNMVQAEFAVWNAACENYFTVQAGTAVYADIAVVNSLDVTTSITQPSPFGYGVQISINPSLQYRGGLYSALLREIGHALGLADALEADSAMNPSAANNFLSLSDTNEVRALYGLDPVSGTLTIFIDPTDKQYNGKHGRFDFYVSEPIGQNVIWNFGDGTFGASRRVLHRFKKRGTFHVTAASLGFSGSLDVKVK